METKNKYSLNQIGNRNPFEVPENYFEEFAVHMDELIVPKETPLIRMMKPWLYMAAMFTGLLLVGNVLLQSHKSSQLQRQSEAYDAYLMSQLDESIYYDYYFTEVNAAEENQSSR
jgi:hypothetical protein